MIVPMKRLALVLMPGERDSVLAGLRALGALHIDLKTGTAPEHEAVLAKSREVLEALAFLGKPAKAKGDVPDDALVRVLDLMRDTRAADENLRLSQAELAFWAPWGDFDPADVASLAAKGVFLNLYRVPVVQDAAFADVPGRVDVGRDKTFVRFAVVSKTPERLSGAEHVAWPEIGPSRRAQLVKDLRRLKERCREQAEVMAAWVPSLRAEAARLEGLVDWESAKGGIGDAEGLAYLTGWVPADRSDAVLAEAKRLGVAVSLSDPGEESVPPTKLKNSFFPRLMKPVFDLLGIIPGYAERDISWPFFLFFSVFFGMILGDAAYGVILTTIGVTFLTVSMLSGGKGRETWTLFTWLGLCTTIWGALTGTWFAVDFELLPPLLQALVPPVFNPSLIGAEAVSNNITVFCFTLGAAQLGLASFWNFLQTVGSNPLKALSHLGWMTLTFSLYLLVLSMVAKLSLLDEFFPQPVLGWFFEVTPHGPALPAWVVPSIIVSYLMVLLFSFQEGKFWKGLFEGVANFLPTSLNAISAFADNISYVRLFAVGLAGYYIEVSFASMAKGFGMDSVGGIAASVLVLVFGHSLNLIMGFLSVIVHGVRLNVLEFSNRLGMEWSGRPYDPFRVKS